MALGSDTAHASGELTIKQAPPYVGPIPETIVLPNGTLRCGACGQEAKTTGSMGSHKRKHYHERQRALAGKPAKVPSAVVTATEPIPAPVDTDLVAALRQTIAVVESMESLKVASDGNERAAEAFLVENVELADRLESLEKEIAELRDENRRLADEVRSTTQQAQDDPDSVRRLSRVESQVELIRGIVARYAKAEAGPVRTLIEIEDLLARP